MDYLKIASVSLSKTVLLISCYSLLALSITPSLLMKTALIRGNCLALSAKWLHRNPAPLYPSCSSVADLVNNFIGFFTDKISTIRHELESNPKQGIYLPEDASVVTTKLHRFSCPPHSATISCRDFPSF